MYNVAAYVCNVICDMEYVLRVMLITMFYVICVMFWIYLCNVCKCPMCSATSMYYVLSTIYYVIYSMFYIICVMSITIMFS